MSETVTIRLEAEDRARLRSAADAAGMPLASYLREALSEPADAARREGELDSERDRAARLAKKCEAFTARVRELETAASESGALTERLALAEEQWSAWQGRAQLLEQHAAKLEAATGPSGVVRALRALLDTPTERARRQLRDTFAGLDYGDVPDAVETAAVEFGAACRGATAASHCTMLTVAFGDLLDAVAATRWDEARLRWRLEPAERALGDLKKWVIQH